MLMLLMCALAHSSRTWCGDAPAVSDASLDVKAAAPSSRASALPAASGPFDFALDASADAQQRAARFAIPGVDDFPAAEFKPRAHDLTKPAVSDYGSGDPMFRTTTVWQRLNEFRAQDHRVRVLTLWEMGGSNLSLQAGRKGDPSIQWSSSWTNRSKVGSGLLDRFLAASLNGMANRNRGSHFSPASATPPPPLMSTAVAAAK